MSPLPHLHSLSNRILDAENDAYGELYAAADELYNFLLQLTAVDTDENNNREKKYLESGHAIGLTWAAMCIKDLMRTKKFMDGIYKAVHDIIKKATDRPVHILYAGTGPFATLVLPLTARFTSSQIRFTLLEVNENSFHCLQKLVFILQLESYIEQMKIADAAMWNAGTNNGFDIFISETMNTALTKEPQVTIFMNIIPQLQPGTIIIPENVRLQAALIDPVKRMKRKMNNDKVDDSVYLPGNVFELNRETILQHTTAFKRSGANYKFPETIITIPPGQSPAYSDFCILTDITIYDTIQLLTDQSPLTMPLKLTELKKTDGEKIKCYYETGENPGVRLG